MALIPPDAAIRLRMETEQNLQPVSAIKELSTDLANLPSLRPGQTFTAQIQQVLPENSYHALVAGKEITLSLPSAAKAGDTLELVVVERNSRLLVAQLADQAKLPANNNTDAKITSLSPAAQLIGKLLLPAGQKPIPALLNDGQPLIASPLPSARNIAATLAPLLKQAATQSGLFYESHQALWLAGERTTESLLAEPQAQHSIARALNHANLANSVQNDAPADKTAANLKAISETDDTLSGIRQAQTHQIPDDLRPLVQQQLDAAITQRLVWHGEVWPQQTMQWEVERELTEKTALELEEVARWNSTLALTMPNLGRIEAAINLSKDKVNITLSADSGVSVSKLNTHLPALFSALDNAGLLPISIKIRDGNAQK